MPNRERELTFWEHLVELIARIRVMLIAVAISTLFVMVVPMSLDVNLSDPSNPWYPTVASLAIRKLQQDFLPSNVTLLPISWFAPIEVYMIVSLMLGTMISLPIIAYELYRFINPAIRQHEKKMLSSFVLSFVALFLSGFSIGYLFVTPATVRVLLLFARILGLPSTYEFTEFFWLVAGSLLVCGFILTCPIYIVLVVKAGIMKTRTLAKNRKFLYPAIIVAISLIDPDPTIITETLIGVPLIILIEISLRIARRFERESSGGTT